MSHSLNETVNVNDNHNVKLFLLLESTSRHPYSAKDESCTWQLCHKSLYYQNDVELNYQYETEKNENFTLRNIQLPQPFISGIIFF